MTSATNTSPALEYGAKAMHLMGDNSIEPTPGAYSVWYAYASGENPEINTKINERFEASKPFDSPFMYELESLLGAPEEQLTDSTIEAGEQLSGKMDNVIELIASVSGDTNRFGKSMQGVSDALNSEISAADLGQVVETIVAATKQMETRSRELEEKLTESKSEVEELRSNLAQARSEALTDQLTGIANRKAFDEVLLSSIAEASQNGSEMCLAMADIDFFKKFNDTFGHQAGDQVLRLVGRCLSNNVKGQDTPARYGGEEFAMILPNTALEDALKLSNHIRETVKSRELVKKSTGENLGRVTMSLGVAQFAMGDTPQTMIARADAALYEAKEQGRNRVVAADSTAAAEPAQAAG
ncbi:GGDEF domain-containing protein [Parvibaculaceae bacterium PLY_AMNH_Bact1]|nr:GGDEF domain-containing protein [Parvibaculaceae bacterium PLY_AMNH_Bact1]